MGDAALPLDGINVIAIEQAVAAPFCTSRLADAGASVVKIEVPAGDFARGYDDVAAGQSSYFVWLNRGKTSRVADLATDTGKALLEALLETADVLVQNLKPGALARLGFEPAALCRRFPRLICCSISGYGEAGPYADRKAYDLLIQAESGLAAITGGPDEPSRVGISVVDIATGATAHAAILEALLARERIGAGADIRISMFDVMADWMTVPLLHQEAGSPPRRVGLAHPSIAPYGVFALADGKRLLISIQSDREWRSLAESVLGRPDLAVEPRFATNLDRVRNRAETDEAVAIALSDLDNDTAQTHLSRAQIAFAAVNELSDLSAHPHLRRMTVGTPNGPVSYPAPAPIVVGQPRDYGSVPALDNARDSAAGASPLYRSVNPATGVHLQNCACHSDVEADAALDKAVQAFATWRGSTFDERRLVLRRMADLLDAERDPHALTITSEMGKTLVSARAEVAKCAVACRWFADHGEELQRPELIDQPSGHATVRYTPMGTILAIMPWNFPFWQFVRYLAPSLMAGNTTILKHAPSTPGSALALIDLALRAGLPDGVVQNLFLRNEQAARLIADPRIAAVTLTGSERAGIAVGAAAGAAIKRAVLELGGSDPLIVMPSCDFDEAVKAAVFARNQNNGQSCVCAKRILVSSEIYDRFRDALVRATKALVVGDPLLSATDIGPLATLEARDRLSQQVASAVAQGADVLVGGRAPDGPGAYYLPTVLEHMTEENSVRREELFGPVAMLMRFEDRDQAVAIANETSFGLGASLWSRDPEEQDFFIDRLECGMTFVNAVTASQPGLPFGGVKRSGVGRELGAWGMKEFMNVRTIVNGR